MVDAISSTANRLVKDFKALHRARGRRESSTTLVEGPNAFVEFIESALLPTMVLCAADDTDTLEACATAGVAVRAASPAVLAAASDTKNPRGPIAMLPVPPGVGLRSRDTAVLVDVADPGNVGTVIRTAAAFGWDVAVCGTTADPWSPKVIRSAAGAHVHTRIATLDDPVTELRDADLAVVAAAIGASTVGDRPDGPVGLMIGNEARGLDRSIVDAADMAVSIPMSGNIESLNAAVAASLLMYVFADR